MGDKEGETPLILAISRKYDDIVRFLITKGANVNHKTERRNWTPIYYAAAVGSVEILNLLIDMQADVNTLTDLKRSPLSIACYMGRTEAVSLLLKHPKILIN